MTSKSIARNIRNIAIGSIAGVGMAMSAFAPARADAGAPIAAAAVPSCVVITALSPQGSSPGIVGMDNRCGRAVKVQVVINNWFDGPCHTISAGGHYTYEWTFGTWDGLKSC